MTKEQFLNGTIFRIAGPTYKGACTYYLNHKAECISKQIRSSVDEKVIIDDYECNITKIGRLGFTGITHVMKKRVVVKFKFEDLVEFIEEEK
jgi:hypothetical protein